ncbi:hypothetical protein ABIA39_006919 [Nocardia sp. GAS34]
MAAPAATEARLADQLYIDADEIASYGRRAKTGTEQRNSMWMCLRHPVMRAD